VERRANRDEAGDFGAGGNAVFGASGQNALGLPKLSSANVGDESVHGGGFVLVFAVPDCSGVCLLYGIPCRL
jgi:hypothetical protein